ncbi:MAG: DUF4097 family beta strand repeat protein [Planctomycetes bacterium]|nr:DUF4097 family beta strand repeat protein [Planctomycetota bacterium]MBI3844977.1 DUF4097 family beta strand repeat protein [Planctomycetota bacterium]
MHRPMEFLALTLLAGTSCAYMSAVRATEEVRVQKPLTANAAHVSVENITGDVAVETWDRDEVLVVAEKEAQGRDDADARENLGRIRVDVEPTADGLSVVTRLLEGHASGGVSYHLTVPAWARVEVKVVTGDVDLEGLTGGVDVHVTTGDVMLRGVATPAAANVVTGTIDVFVSDLEHPVSLETVTGNVKVGLPNGKGARLDTETTVGSIACDGNVKVSRDSVVGARANGSINGGGPDVHVRVTTGDIRVTQRPRAGA